MTIETELPAVKVKPLEWKDGIGLSTAQTNIVACYSVWDVDDEFWLCSLVDGRFPSMEAAKSAAQADYARRILSALVPSTTAESRCEELVKALEFYADELTWADTNPQNDAMLTVLVPSPSFAEIDRGKLASAALKELGKGDGR